MADNKIELYYEGGAKAFIHCVSPGTSFEDIEDRLDEEGIINGILDDELKEVVKVAASSKENQYDVLAAKCASLDEAIELIDGRRMGVADMVAHLRDLFDLLTKSVDDDALKGIFVLEGERAVILHKMTNECDIFNNVVVDGDIAKDLIFDPETIKFNSVDDTFEYYAAKTGYLCVDPSGKLVIFDPFFVSNDLMSMYVTLVPICFGREKLIDAAIQKYKSYSVDYLETPVTKETLEELLNNNTVSKFKVRQGIAPVHGEDSYVVKKVADDNENLYDEQGNIDHAARTSYHVVKKGTLIAEKISLKKGKNGVNVHDMAVTADLGKDIAFIAKQNIHLEEDEENGVTRYFADIDGLLIFKDEYVEVDEVLHIRSDVSFETGNLVYHKNIIVDGNVKGTFQVKCGKNLIIKKNVENGAYVSCAGDLVVHNGIFGENSTVRVRNEATIGFIQNSNIEVGGNLTINNFAVHSQIVCQRKVTVNGGSVKNNNKGCVIGGRIVSMENILFHSIGSENDKTEVFCGINPELYNKYTDLKQLQNVLIRKLATTQNSIGFDIKSPEAVQKMSKMTKIQKHALKTKLAEMKRLAEEQDQVNANIRKIQKLALNEDFDQLAITVIFQIVPDIVFNIGTVKKLINQNDYHKKYMIRDRIIKAEDYNK